MAESPLAEDLESVVSQTSALWDELKGSRFFITGGTGFFGCWLLESLVHANRKLGLDVRATILTRDEEAFRAKCPHLASMPELSFHKGDVRSFDFPGGDFTHVIHAATEASDRMNREQPEVMREAIVAGTKRTLEFAQRAKARKFLLTSSGAVYGRQRPDVLHVSEEDPGVSAPLDPPSAYAEGKREAERLCVAAAHRGFEPKIARGFAFVGPYLPLDIHFAVGNFIRDALRGGPIEVRGDGAPYRSYLYSADLAVWLWTILLKGEAGKPYNIGSERRVTVAELARIVAGVVDPRCAVKIAGRPTPGKAPEQYVPSTQRAQKELGLRETFGLEESIRRTAAWARGEAPGRLGP
jgi:dTDP-glucose 4,6-dehydratase